MAGETTPQMAKVLNFVFSLWLVLYYNGHQAILLQDPGHPQHPTTLQSGDLSLRKGQGESRKR